MGAFIIIGGVLILAIIVWGLRSIRKLSQEKNKPLSSQAMQFELNAEIKPLQVEETYNQRKKRVMTLMLGGIAAVVLLAAFGGFVSNFVGGQEQKAEEQRLRKEAEQEVAALLPDDLPMVAGASRYSKQGMYVRFVEYKAQKMVEILAKQKSWEKAAAQFEAKASQPEKLELIAGKVRYDEYQKLYDDMLSEQKRDFDKVQKLSFADWIVNQSYIYEIILFVIFFGLCIRSYKKKNYQIFLWSCLGAGIACLFGIWYWGLWLNIGFLVTCCLVLVGAGLLTLSGFIELKDDSDGYFIICWFVGYFLLACGLLFFGMYCAGGF